MPRNFSLYAALQGAERSCKAAAICDLILGNLWPNLASPTNSVTLHDGISNDRRTLRVSARCYQIGILRQVFSSKCLCNLLDSVCSDSSLSESRRPLFCFCNLCIESELTHFCSSVSNCQSLRLLRCGRVLLRFPNKRTDNTYPVRRIRHSCCVGEAAELVKRLWRKGEASSAIREIRYWVPNSARWQYQDSDRTKHHGLWNRIGQRAQGPRHQLYQAGAFASEVMRLSGGSPDNTLYDNETSGTGSGGFHIPSNMAEDIREARFTELTEPSVK